MHRILLKKYKRHGGNASLLPSQIASSPAACGDSSRGQDRPLHKVKGQLYTCVCVCVNSWAVVCCACVPSELVFCVYTQLLPPPSQELRLYAGARSRVIKHPPPKATRRRGILHCPRNPPTLSSGSVRSTEQLCRNSVQEKAVQATMS